MTDLNGLYSPKPMIGRPLIAGRVFASPLVTGFEMDNQY